MFLEAKLWNLEVSNMTEHVLEDGYGFTLFYFFLNLVLKKFHIFQSELFFKIISQDQKRSHYQRFVDNYKAFIIVTFLMLQFILFIQLLKHHYYQFRKYCNLWYSQFINFKCSNIQNYDCSHCIHLCKITKEQLNAVFSKVTLTFNFPPVQLRPSTCCVLRFTFIKL